MHKRSFRKKITGDFWPMDPHDQDDGCGGGGRGCWGNVAVVGLDLFIFPPLCCKRRGGCKNNFFIAASPIVTRCSFPLLTFPSKQASNQYMDQKPNRKTKSWSERKKATPREETIFPLSRKAQWLGFDAGTKDEKKRRGKKYPFSSLMPATKGITLCTCSSLFPRLCVHVS